MRSEASDPSLLNTIQYTRLDDGTYECELSSIGFGSFGSYVPTLTVRLDRERDGLLVIRVLRVRILTRGRWDSEPRELQGATADSCNRVSWAPHDGAEAEVRLRTDLELKVAIEVPRRLPLPLAAVEQPGSLILRNVCRVQCRQFLADIERGYRAWCRTGLK